MGACTREREWYYFIAVGLATFFGGLLILIPCRIIYYFCFHRSSSHDQSATAITGTGNEPVVPREGATRTCFRKLRAGAMSVLSGHTFASKFLVIGFFMLNMVASVIYLTEATEFEVEGCGPVREDNLQLTYIALCVVFFLHYITRFIASPDKLYFWLDIYSIVDHFTIGPTMYGLYKDSNWLGLKFLRMLYLLQLPEILQQMHILKSSKSIRLAQVATIFAAIWLVSSGMVHMTENNGDPFHDYDNAQDLGYWMAVYWLLVTMSTVGYGEVSPTTDLGRAFIVIFIMGSFAMFSQMIPELAKHLGKSTRYTKPYKRVYGKRHIVVCGHITYNSVTNFIKNFIHEDADNRDTNVVFIDSKKPDLELSAFFRRRINDVTFLQGTLMDVTSLRAVKMKDAEACVILADRASDDPDEEDGANIMRATAVKNYNRSTRIIIQLLQSYNKTYLLYIPNWNWSADHGDDVICISELKLGIMAQNCLAPGVATLLSNLFTMRSYNNTDDGSWLTSYRYGAANELYVERFSMAFVGMEFTDAARICFENWNIVLIAIETPRARVRGSIRINPNNDTTIGSNTLGFFIAQSPDVVKRMQSHGITSYKSTGMKRDSYEVSVTRNGKNVSTTICNPSSEPLTDMDGDHTGPHLEYLHDIGNRENSFRGRRPSVDQGSSRTQYDYTGMYHWCPERTLEDSKLTHKSLSQMKLENHVVVILMADADSPITGVCHFIMPLRTNNFHPHEMKDIILLCDASYIAKEWNTISNFPKVYVFEGQAGIRSDLRALHLDRASMCVIMSARKQQIIDSHNMDIDAILTTLNVQSMFSNNVEQQIRSLGLLSNMDEFRNHVTSKEIPLTTELEIDSNVAYLDQDDEDDPNMPLYMTVPVASGRAVAASVLDSLMSATYMDSRLLTILRALITGASSAEFEQILADSLGIVRKQRYNQTAKDRARLALFHLDSEPLQRFKSCEQYVDLFVGALREQKIICIGLYRLLDSDDAETEITSTKRYVITNPTKDFELLPTDMVFCLQPYPEDINNNTNNNNPIGRSGSRKNPSETGSNSMVLTNQENESCSL